MPSITTTTPHGYGRGDVITMPGPQWHWLVRFAAWLTSTRLPLRQTDYVVTSVISPNTAEIMKLPEEESEE